MNRLILGRAIASICPFAMLPMEVIAQHAIVVDVDNFNDGDWVIPRPPTKRNP